METITTIYMEDFSSPQEMYSFLLENNAPQYTIESRTLNRKLLISNEDLFNKLKYIWSIFSLEVARCEVYLEDFKNYSEFLEFKKRYSSNRIMPVVTFAGRFYIEVAKTSDAEILEVWEKHCEYAPSHTVFLKKSQTLEDLILTVNSLYGNRSIILIREEDGVTLGEVPAGSDDRDQIVEEIWKKNYTTINLLREGIYSLEKLMERVQGLGLVNIICIENSFMLQSFKSSDIKAIWNSYVDQAKRHGHFVGLINVKYKELIHSVGTGICVMRGLEGEHYVVDSLINEDLIEEIWYKHCEKAPTFTLTLNYLSFTLKDLISQIESLEDLPERYNIVIRGGETQTLLGEITVGSDIEQAVKDIWRNCTEKSITIKESTSYWHFLGTINSVGWYEIIYDHCPSTCLEIKSVDEKFLRGIWDGITMCSGKVDTSHYDKHLHTLSDAEKSFGEIKLDPYMVSNVWGLGNKDPSGCLFHMLKTIARFGDKEGNSVSRELASLQATLDRLKELSNE